MDLVRLITRSTTCLTSTIHPMSVVHVRSVFIHYETSCRVEQGYNRT